jgi:hypothetical protein
MLLPPRFSATSANVAAILCVVRTNPPVGELRDDNLMHRRYVDGRFEDILGQLEITYHIAVEVNLFDDRHFFRLPIS